MKGFEEALKCVEAPAKPANRLYYLALSPSLYEPTILNLRATGMARDPEAWRRVVIEKPFGADLASAQALNKSIHSVFTEDEVFRIDHYLGKETVQNILVLRFANTIFEPVWNRNYTDNVQITVAETVDLADRAGYYNQAGVFRDMFQNHILQLLTVAAMEPPSNFQAELLCNENVKVLNAVRRVTRESAPEIAVAAQYDGYLGEPGVHNDSHTLTYAAVRIDIDNWRWQDVPFYLRSGKALDDKRTAIVIQFPRPPHLMFPQEIFLNILAIQVQPDAGIHIEFQAKTPDEKMDLRHVDLEFHYDDSFGRQDILDTCERLLLDAKNGDASLFTCSDEIEEAWEIMDPIIQGLATPDAQPISSYAKGSEGPDEADRFLAKYGHKWLNRNWQH